MKVTTCPGCGGTQSETLGLPASGFSAVAGGQTFAQPPYSILACGTCGLWYKSDVADGETLGRYYALVNFRKWEIPGLFPTERVALDVLRRVPKGGRILDFGCSSGRLLERLTRDYECIGFEISEEAAAIAAAKGIRMLADPSNAGAGSMDAVVLMDVFEHLVRPTDTLKTLAGLLKPGGLLVISTGTTDCPVSQEQIEHFWYWRNIEHLVMFNDAYAAYLCKTLGAARAAASVVSHYDTPVTDRILQQARRLAYRTFHPRPAAWAAFAAAIPLVGRARNWQFPPQVICSRDHVVVALPVAGQAAE